MSRIAWLGLVLALPLASCTNPLDSRQPTGAAPSPLGADEAEMRDALGELQTIEVAAPGGEIVLLEVPTEAVCSDAECAVRAAASFFTYQDDVTQGRLIAQWNALSGDDCYFCADTIAVGEEARAAGESVSGGTLTLADTPAVLTEDWVVDMPPFTELGRIDEGTVMLSMLLRQSAVTFTPATGDPITFDEKVATFLVALQWNGTYWTVETVAIT